MRGTASALLVLCFAVPSNAGTINPIARVAELMQGLADKVTKDGEAEQELFDKYVCWYKTVVSTKKASNTAAEERIGSLEQYIKDIEGGKIEFTNERASLEKEVADLEGEIKTSKDMRAKEAEDYADAKDEMEKAIASLEKAVEVLGAATEDSKEGVLMAMQSELKQAIHFGAALLNENEAKLIEKALSQGGHINNLQEDPDWKKLNKDATFNKKYKARSSKIQEILADMLQTFEDNLVDANKKEKDTKASFAVLLESKESQLRAAQEALSAGSEEAGARALNKGEAQEEVNKLTDMVENDEKFIKQAEDAYKVKSEEWKERKRLRTAEVASITEAIGILRSDEAKDITKKSFKSQGGALLLQVNNGETSLDKCMRKARTRKVLNILKEQANKHKDLRLTLIAADLRSGGQFDKVLTSVDKMIEDLHSEEDEDLAVKEQCEKDRMENTKTAKKTSQNIDDKTALINRKKAQIADLNTKIATAQATIKNLKLQLEEAKVMRQSETAEYEVAKQDDKAAKGLVEKAAGVLSKFYEDEMSLAQQSKKAVKKQPFTSPAGEAPPPPPTTWAEPYGGSPGESAGVQAILEMIAEDIEKDIKTATTEENEAQAEYEAYKADTEEAISDLESEISAHEGEIGDKQEDVETAKEQRKDEKTILDNTLAFLRSIAPSCDYMAVNFELRRQNRFEEIEGLLEAKGALGGGKFDFLQLQREAPECVDQ
eukprot:gnl/MRDRNA2_/MRDRNA2_87326_c0_seq1.p1 gnl/MRDRNA2_/MRDRNA2_87326_c0~~gnl/MRDRNA2_/MRDRNA2_87326_c0_seq1.p1  ORF type:complete len:717 (-),score=265.28 gnl/MRDRNA2_/MRDRNA2_87326_c0_seq1:8-2158(-)